MVCEEGGLMPPTPAELRAAAAREEGLPLRKVVRIVLVNDSGHIIGEDHWRARLRNATVDNVWDMRDTGMSYQAIATAVGCSKSTVRDICKGRRRAQTATGQKRIVMWIAGTEDVRQC